MRPQRRCRPNWRKPSPRPSSDAARMPDARRSLRDRNRWRRVREAACRRSCWARPGSARADLLGSLLLSTLVAAVLTIVMVFVVGFNERTAAGTIGMAVLDKRRRELDRAHSVQILGRNEGRSLAAAVPDDGFRNGPGRFGLRFRELFSREYPPPLPRTRFSRIRCRRIFTAWTANRCCPRS